VSGSEPNPDGPTASPFHSAQAGAGRIIVGRLLPGADLIAGLEAACDHHGVRFAAVAFAYGSLSSAGFKTLQTPAGSDRPLLTLRRVDGRLEFLGGQGLICRGDDGARATHLHGCVSDETGQVLGGHFERGLNPVYNNMDFTLTELLGIDLIRRWDQETDTVEMVVVQGAEDR
jgi:uncharacterized protein